MRKIIFILSFVFLGLAIMHGFLYYQEFPYIPFEDLGVEYCGGDDELTFCLSAEEIKQIWGVELPDLQLASLYLPLEEYTDLLNETNRSTNLCAIIGYSIAFLITLISLIKIKKKNERRR